MKNKGFTLIELLAVIVILAIIALIATPIILNIIDSTKEESVKRSIDHYMSAATIAIASENLEREYNPTSCEIQESGNIKCKINGSNTLENEAILVEVDGDKPTGGTITFENGKITNINLTMPDGNIYELDEKGNILKTGESDGSGVDTPSVSQNRIPSGGLYYVNVTGPISGVDMNWYVTSATTKSTAGEIFPTPTQLNDVYVYDGWVYIFGGNGGNSAGTTLHLEDGVSIYAIYTGRGDKWGAKKYSNSAGPMLTTINGVGVFEIND